MDPSTDDMSIHDDQLDFSCTAPHGARTTLSLTANLAAEFQKVLRDWDWSDDVDQEPENESVEQSAGLSDILKAIDRVQPLLREANDAVLDPLYRLPLQTWQLVRRIRRMCVQLDEWIMLNFLETDDSFAYGGPFSERQKVVHLYSYGRQLIRNQTIANHCKQFRDDADLVEEMINELDQVRDEMDVILEVSRARGRRRLAMYGVKIAALSREDRSELWRRYTSALQDEWSSWDAIRNLLALETRGDTPDPLFPHVEYTMKYRRRVEDVAKKEILTAIEASAKEDKLSEVSYNYLALDIPDKHIRVISDIRKRSSGDLQLVLREISLYPSEEQPYYEPSFTALSYTWGLPGPPLYIWIGNQRLAIQRSAYNFLNHYVEQLPGKTAFGEMQPIWIDAICINQQDVQERNVQVTIMGEIYRLADQVWVWLDGCSNDMSLRHKYNGHLLNTSLQEEAFTGQFNGCAETTTFERWLRGDCLYCRHTLGVLPYDSTTLAPWQTIIDHPYWTRLWILQELSLAKCNPQVIIANFTISAASFNKSGAKTYGEPYVDCMISREVEPSTLSALINIFSDRTCSDKHDFVYALLSMTPYASTFMVDYTESLDELFVRAISLLLDERQDKGMVDELNITQEPIVNLATAMSVLAGTKFVEYHQTMVTRVTKGHAMALLEPVYKLSMLRTRRISASPITMTCYSVGGADVDAEIIYPDQFRHVAQNGSRFASCLAYEAKSIGGAIVEPDEDDDYAECLIECLLNDKIGLLLAGRRTEVEILCFSLGEELFAIPRDTKARWEEDLRQGGWSWKAAWSDFAFDREASVRCSMLEYAHLVEVLSLLAVQAAGRQYSENEAADVTTTLSLPNAIRRICPPIRALIPTRLSPIDTGTAPLSVES